MIHPTQRYRIRTVLAAADVVLSVAIDRFSPHFPSRRLITEFPEAQPIPTLRLSDTNDLVVSHAQRTLRSPRKTCSKESGTGVVAQWPQNSTDKRMNINRTGKLAFSSSFLKYGKASV